MDCVDYFGICLAAAFVGGAALATGIALLTDERRPMPWFAWMLVVVGVLFVSPVLVKLWLAVVLG